MQIKGQAMISNSVLIDKLKLLDTFSNSEKDAVLRFQLTLANKYQNNIELSEKNYPRNIKTEQDRALYRRCMAFEIYKLCAEKGDMDSIEEIARYYNNQNDTLCDENMLNIKNETERTAYRFRALYFWLQAMIDGQNGFAMKKLAELYLNNIEIPANERDPKIIWKNINLYYKKARQMFADAPDEPDAQEGLLMVDAVLKEINEQPLCFVISHRRTDLLQMLLYQSDSIDILYREGKTSLQIALSLTPPIPRMIDLVHFRQAIEPCFKNYPAKIINLFLRIKADFMNKVVVAFESLQPHQKLTIDLKHLKAIADRHVKEAAVRWIARNRNDIDNYFLARNYLPETDLDKECSQMLQAIMTHNIEIRMKKSENFHLSKNLKPYITFIIDETKFWAKRGCSIPLVPTHTQKTSLDIHHSIREIILSYLIKKPKSIKTHKLANGKLHSSLVAWQELCNNRYKLSKLICDRKPDPDADELDSERLMQVEDSPLPEDESQAAKIKKRKFA